MGSDSETEKTAQKEREKKKMLVLAPIAKPLAGKKLCKRTLKLVRRGMQFTLLTIYFNVMIIHRVLLIDFWCSYFAWDFSCGAQVLEERS